LQIYIAQAACAWQSVAMKTNMTATLNGNKFVKVPHLFVVGKGTFFPTAEIAQAQAYSANGVGMWTEEIEHDGKTYFQSGYTNVWD
jgi:hypothetical protein